MNPPPDPLQAVQEARGWLQLATDDFPGPILVCLDRAALDATHAASRGLGLAWPPLPDGTYPPAPVFTPSEINELAELCSLPDNSRSPAPSVTQPLPCNPGREAASTTSAAPATPRGLRPAPTARAGAPRGTWDRLQLLRAVVHAKRTLAAKVVPWEMWKDKNLEEDEKASVPWAEINPKEPAAPLTRKAPPW